MKRFCYDLLFLLGCAIFAYGFWLAWRPLGFICGGFMLAAFAFLSGCNHLAVPSAESEE